MQKLGKRRLTLNLPEPMTALPAALVGWPLSLKAGGTQLEYTFDTHDAAVAGHPRDIPSLLRRLTELGIAFKDLHTSQSSLEEIFVNLVSGEAEARP
jgi:ABC-2 type transport system ATP-binding protein